MVQFYYRAMKEENGKPKIGRHARFLGIRLKTDIEINYMPRDLLDEEGYLCSETGCKNSGEKVEVAIKNRKGMSVSLTIEGLPPHRKPKELGGNGVDPIWKIKRSSITGDLEAEETGGSHVSIKPRITMLLTRYEKALAKTQDDWIKVN